MHVSCCMLSSLENTLHAGFHQFGRSAPGLPPSIVMQVCDVMRFFNPRCESRRFQGLRWGTKLGDLCRISGDHSPWSLTAPTLKVGSLKLYKISPERSQEDHGRMTADVRHLRSFVAPALFSKHFKRAVTNAVLRDGGGRRDIAPPLVGLPSSL